METRVVSQDQGVSALVRGVVVHADVDVGVEVWERARCGGVCRTRVMGGWTVGSWKVGVQGGVVGAGFGDHGFLADLEPEFGWEVEEGGWLWLAG